MEVRRIIRVGERSYGITLPKEWIELHGLAVGSPLRLIVDREKITIFPHGEEAASRKITIGGDDPEKILRDVIACYIEGANEVEVRTGHISAVVGKIEDKLPGVVLMEEGGVLKIKIVTREDLNIDEVIRSMYTTVDIMSALFIEMLEIGNKRLASEILRLDDQLDRLYFFSLRTVKRNIILKPEVYVDYVIAIKNLEHVGDAIDRATNYYLQNDLGCTEDVVKIYRKAYEFLQNAFHAFYNNDPNRALKVLLQRADLARETLSGACPEAAPVMHEAASIVATAADIAEAAYSKAIRQ